MVSHTYCFRVYFLKISALFKLFDGNGEGEVRGKIQGKIQPILSKSQIGQVADIFVVSLGDGDPGQAFAFSPSDQNSQQGMSDPPSPECRGDLQGWIAIIFYVLNAGGARGVQVSGISDDDAIAMIDCKIQAAGQRLAHIAGQGEFIAD
jgi:hypothetical protein